MSRLHRVDNRAAVLIPCSVDIMAFIKDNPPPATVILISGDRDFAYLLSTVRWRKYNVVLISNSFMTHESLTVQASVVYDWKSDILKTRPPPKPPAPGSQTLSSIASLTTPQELNNLPESDVHTVDSLNERVAPTVQPSTPPPRPASTVANTVAVNTTRPRSATLPSNASSVDSEAMGLPPKAGTHAKTASAGIPSNPISDDWVEADLTGGSTMVHPSSTRGVTVNLSFKQDPTSPGATDPIDDGGVYSPAFVSICAGVCSRSAADPGISELPGNEPVEGRRQRPLLSGPPSSHR